MSMAPRVVVAKQPANEIEEKQVALSYLHEAWTEARLDGVDGDCLAQASLFAAFAELVGTYGEDAANRLACARQSPSTPSCRASAQASLR